MLQKKEILREGLAEQDAFSSLSDFADICRITANNKLDPKVKSSLGQFMTPSPICDFMASLFDRVEGDIKLLDPGCGVGSLSAAFIQRVILNGKASSIDGNFFEIEEKMLPFLEDVIQSSANKANNSGIPTNYEIHKADFILSQSQEAEHSLFKKTCPKFTHAILNPPYKKISTEGEHRKALRLAGIETVNLYSGFTALAIKLLEPGGEIVAIIPRSFCNGPYYQPFRELILKETSIRHIHIFESRDRAFSDDDVLQENIIIHCVKGVPQRKVVITSSPQADFEFDKNGKSMSATDMTTRTVPIEKIVNPDDSQSFIHIAANESEQRIIDSLSCFVSTLEDLDIQISTGPVVDFRMKDDLRENPEDGAVPLLYPVHLNGSVSWPKESKKPNAIMLTEKSMPWLWDNVGNFVITRRFSSKEEKRRIVASLYDSSLPFEKIGFENKLNVFHHNKHGLDEAIAKGLFVYLNSTILDKYYRQFGGHTQVNAADLRSLHYPDLETLRRIGEKLESLDADQGEIDRIIFEEIKMADDGQEDPLALQQKIDNALQILTELGMPRAQLNERSALTLLALLDLQPSKDWTDCQRPLIGVTPIMDWCYEQYGKQYAPNTRETFRRQTLHQFVEAGIALYNPDEPNRPVNSPKACYQVAPELFDVLLSFGSDNWADSLAEYLKIKPGLVEVYGKARDMEMIPLKVADDTEINLTPGAHSQLIYDIVQEFGPRFAPGAEVIYVGDTGEKVGYFLKDRLSELGVDVDKHGKMPDVVLYDNNKDWLLLIEAVTSHGPVDGKRYTELSELFANSKPGLVYVTAFPDRKTMVKYLPVISWETEVWLSDAPTHLIHFNGDRYLGPHE